MRTSAARRPPPQGETATGLKGGADVSGGEIAIEIRRSGGEQAERDPVPVLTAPANLEAALDRVRDRGAHLPVTGHADAELVLCAATAAGQIVQLFVEGVVQLDRQAEFRHFDLHRLPGPRGLPQQAGKGSRSRQTKDLRTESAYLFGAIFLERGGGAALVLPRADAAAMGLHLEEISRAVAPDADAGVLLDQAGWHVTGKLGIPDNISLMPVPAKSPELNPAEIVWLYLRQNWLSNRVFDNYDAIVQACCQAWNNLIDRPREIMSTGPREWARTGQC